MGIKVESLVMEKLASYHDHHAHHFKFIISSVARMRLNIDLKFIEFRGKRDRGR